MGKAQEDIVLPKLGKAIEYTKDNEQLYLEDVEKRAEQK